MFKQLFQELVQEVKALHTKLEELKADLQAQAAPAIQEGVKLAEGEAEKIAEAVDQKLGGTESAPAEQPAADQSASQQPSSDGVTHIDVQEQQ